MRIAETVTFGGGGLARHAELRDKPAEIARLTKHTEASVLLLWRGKVLVSGGDEPFLARTRYGSEISGHANTAPIFMGQVAGAPFFAQELSNWHPDDQSDTNAGFFDTAQVRHPDLPADQQFVDLREVMARLSPLDAELAASAKAIFAWHAAHLFCAKCGQPSEISMSGWQRQCSGCGAHHFPRTDPVVIMLITHGNNVLLGRSPHWPEKMFSLLAGFVEPGETLENAVRREVFEEAGVEVGQVSYLASQPWPFPASLMVGCHGVALGTDITIDPVEIEEALWISREDLMDVFAGANPDILPARPGSIAHFLLENWLADRLE
jgi:NAD+ diphosphatase